MKSGPVVIRCLGLAGHAVKEAAFNPAGDYLEGFDPEAGYGWGAAAFTRDLQRAMVFPDLKAAYEFIGTRPKTRPTRPDGKPNRPLTAFTLQILPRDAAG